MEQDDLVIDVRGCRIESLRDFVAAVRAVESEAFPEWQGWSLDALWDTFWTGGISDLIDNNFVVVRADRGGLLVPGNRSGEGLVELFAEVSGARLELFD
ncbi:hypothetical protein AB0442_10380 [Kitasatospora sp. NPDC085895]|uniref:hypothetical protein n=1 Tax=Kitasatospora sp. NPDC085895 TaxID=3155057 RepID=UPI00344FB6A5